MKHLLEISKIVTKKKVKKIEIFDDNSLKQKSSRFNDFYELLMNGTIQTDQEAAQILYDGRPTDDKYRQLKSRFKKRLLNTLFFLDVNQSATSNYNRAYYSCHRDWTLIKILLSNKANDTGAQLARNILTIALKFNFSDIIVNAARILRQHASDTSNEHAYHEYNEICKKHNIVLNAEIEVEEHAQFIGIWHDLPMHKLDRYIAAIEERCTDISQIYKQYNSPVIFYNYFLAHTFYHEALKNYEYVYELCLKAEEHIEQHPHFYRADQMAQLACKKLLALLHLGRFEEGYVQAERYANVFDRHTAWLPILEVYLLLALHGKAYDKAHETFNRVYTDKRFKNLDEIDAVKWNTFETYLCFLRWLEVDNDEDKPKRYKQFRVKRFLEEPIIFPKQQRIFTITSVIAQILFLLEQKQWGEAFERVERLRDYSARLLKPEEYYRILQFCRLLQQLAKAHFDYDKIGVHLKYLERLETESMHYRGGINELEIIPYQHLWDIVLRLSRQQVAEQ
ncbi:MAG: hypothetical protein AB8E82_12825 [Aureispira sp.]